MKLVKICGKPSVSYYRVPDDFSYDENNVDLEAIAPYEITEEDYGLEQQQLQHIERERAKTP